MRVDIPGGAKDWWSILPEPYDRDQKVCIVMAPIGEGWRTEMGSTRDGKYHAGFLVSPKGGMRGLQIIDTNLDDYMEHREVFSRYGVVMADPAFIGKLSEIPDALLLDGMRAPLVFCLGAMWRNYLDLNRTWKRAELKC